MGAYSSSRGEVRGENKMVWGISISVAGMWRARDEARYESGTADVNRLAKIIEGY